MSSRLELKARVNYRTAIKLAELFKEVYEVDHGGILGGYQVNSLYFDNEELHEYFSKLDGHELKEKHRVRFYNNEFKCSAEAKAKKDKSVIKKRLDLKTSSSCPLGQLLEELRQGYDHLPMVTGRAQPWATQKPVLMISYFRRAFSLENGTGLRLTLDTGIGANSCFTPEDTLIELVKGVQIFHPDLAIFEIKSSGPIPKWLIPIVHSLNISFTNFSKYAYGLERDPFLNLRLQERTMGEEV